MNRKPTPASPLTQRLPSSGGCYAMFNGKLTIEAAQSNAVGRADELDATPISEQPTEAATGLELAPAIQPLKEA